MYFLYFHHYKVDTNSRIDTINYLIQFNIYTFLKLLEYIINIAIYLFINRIIQEMAFLMG